MSPLSLYRLFATREKHEVSHEESFQQTGTEIFGLFVAGCRLDPFLKTSINTRSERSLMGNDLDDVGLVNDLE